MSTSPHSRQDGHRRKRVRKGTRSCWECKRRKIACKFGSDDLNVCEGCLARGTTCLSQEYPEEYDTPGNNQITKRLGRVELLLERLLAKVEGQDDAEKAQKDLHTPESLGANDVPTPFGSNIAAQDDVPLLSVFENQPQSTPASSYEPGAATRPYRLSKLESHRQKLADMLPSQHDVDLVCNNGSCWLVIRGFSDIGGDESVESGDEIVRSTFNVKEVAKKHPSSIARTLIYIALCLQQLPSSFDSNQVHLPMPVKAYAEKLISTVQAFITSDDELVSTIDGLECLLLQGIFHTNGGNPKRAWLSFRRAGNIGQLMGIDKIGNPIRGGSKRWYKSLLLGLQSISTDDSFGPDETFQNPATNKDFLFCRKLAELSARIIEARRNGKIGCYPTMQQIIENLESLSKAMPQSWWEIATFGSDFRSMQSFHDFGRLMTQIWYFQLESVLHFPFMLRAANEPHFAYNKSKCLESLRQMIYRYLAMREVELRSFFCRLIDFGALAATVILILDLIEPPKADQSRESEGQKERDRELVQKVMHLMEQLSKDGGDIVAKRCVNVIRELISPDSGHRGGTIQVAIPYFGTITVNRTPATLLANHNGILQIPSPVPSIPASQLSDPTNMVDGSEQPTQQLNGTPVMSFTNATQSEFNLLDQQIPDWGLQEADTLFFDSLFRTDVNGNWVI